ncbi:hypothetical protein VFC2026_10730 [Listeria monocytogenes]
MSGNYINTLLKLIMVHSLFPLSQNKFTVVFGLNKFGNEEKLTYDGSFFFYLFSENGYIMLVKRTNTP